MSVYLYSTLGCHLCDQAKAILWPLLSHYGYHLQEIDIADSDELIEKYGVRIPVLASGYDGRELGWPFDAVAANSFLAEIVQR